MEPIPTPDDPLETLLGAVAPPAGGPELRQVLLARTSRVVHRRHQWRRLGLAAALAAAYLAGLGTMAFRHEPGQGPPVEMVKRPESPAPTVPPEAPAPYLDPDVPVPVLERLAAAVSPEQRTDYFRRAGDRYLEEDGDLTAAIRCYRKALDAAPPPALAISPNDNWLLMSLKSARLKEKKDAPLDG